MSEWRGANCRLKRQGFISISKALEALITGNTVILNILRQLGIFRKNNQLIPMSMAAIKGVDAATWSSTSLPLTRRRMSHSNTASPPLSLPPMTQGNWYVYGFTRPTPKSRVRDKNNWFDLTPYSISTEKKSQIWNHMGSKRIYPICKTNTIIQWFLD